jgi:hypothetical protein
MPDPIPSKPIPDPNRISWQVFLTPPSKITYILFKAPFILILVAVSYLITWKLKDQVFGIMLSFILGVDSIIFLLFLSNSDDNVVDEYKIDKEGISLNKKKFSYQTLDPNQILTTIKPLALAKKDWGQDLPPKSDLVFGKLKIKFPNESVRQQAISSLMLYLSK